MMREHWRPILQSAGAGTVNRFTVVAVRLFTIPLLLRYLGAEQYGLWISIASFTAYVSLFDFGLVSALVNRLARCYQEERLRRASTYVIATTACLAGVAAIGCGLVLLALRWVDLPRALRLTSPEAIADAYATVAVAVILASLQLVLAAIMRAPYSMQRGYITEGYSLLGTLASFGGILGGVVTGARLPFLAAALMSAPVIGGLATLAHLLTTRRLVAVPLGRRRLIAVAKSLGRSGVDFVVMQAGATLLQALQITILALTQGAAAVVPYGLLQQAVMALQTPMAALQQPLWSRLATYYYAGNLATIRTIVRHYLRIALIYSAGAGAILILLANPLLSLITGSPFVIGLDLRIAFAVLCALGLVAGGNIGAVMMATELTRASASVSVAQVAAFLIVAPSLSSTYGAVGMTLSVMFTYVLALPFQVRLIKGRLRSDDALPTMSARSPLPRSAN